jgi:hypothetical protein
VNPVFLCQENSVYQIRPDELKIQRRSARHFMAIDSLPVPVKDCATHPKNGEVAGKGGWPRHSCYKNGPLGSRRLRAKHSDRFPAKGDGESDLGYGDPQAICDMWPF